MLLSPISSYVSPPFLPVKKEGNIDLSAEHMGHGSDTKEQRMPKKQLCQSYARGNKKGNDPFQAIYSVLVLCWRGFH